MHEQAFGDITTLPFPYLIQKLYVEKVVFQILDIKRRVELSSITHISMINDLASPILSLRGQVLPTMISSYFERP